MKDEHMMKKLDTTKADRMVKTAGKGGFSLYVV